MPELDAGFDHRRSDIMAPLRKHPDDVERTIRIGRDVVGGRARDDSDRGQAAVRRRVLVAQLIRLAERVADNGPASRDAAARAVMLTARLDEDELAW
jgi:hypothetical protein